MYDLVGVDGLVIPPGTPFTSGACESIGGTPPFDQAFIDGRVGFRRQNAGHVSSPGWPAFMEISRKVFDKAPFADVTGVKAGAKVSSRKWTVDGLDGPTRISIVNGEYQTRGGWSSEPGVVDNGYQLKVRHTSACVGGAPVATVITIGDDVYTFMSITAADASCKVPPGKGR